MAINYLNNKDLMKNILLSKAAYTWYIDGTYKTTKYLNYDMILCDEQSYPESRNKLIVQRVNTKLRDTGDKKVFKLADANLDLLDENDWEDIDNRIIMFTGELSDTLLEKAKFAHANRLRYQDGKKRSHDSTTMTEEIDDVSAEDIVIRVHTFEHIPENSTRKNIKKKVADHYEDVNFHPYKHYGYYDGVFQCVAVSHVDQNGEFSTKHGQINHMLALAFLMLCKRYSSKHNWRGYSYAEDMQGQALCQLTMVGLQFNEMYSSNPFSYYTSAIKNAFTITFNEEKRAQETRDTILMKHNQSPSWTKQVEYELSREEHWEKILSDEKDETIEHINEPNVFDEHDADVYHISGDDEDGDVLIDVEPEEEYDEFDFKNYY